MIPSRPLPVVVVAVAGTLASCARVEATPGSGLAGGALTVVDATRDAFSLPAPTLSREARTTFFVGNSFFNQNWVSAPSSVGTRDGLGPLYNARSCSGCHFKDGRSRPPEPGAPFVAALVRISVPGRGPHGEPLPDPSYGDQIQGSGLPGVPPEADVVADYETLHGAFADGEPYTLRRPTYRLENLGYGPVAPGLLLSPRVAPAMIGMGLLEAVPAATIRALADPDDRDEDGISGKANVVWDAVGKTLALGRFGWKAEQPSVMQQAAGALRGDMGITTSLFATENHTDRESPCDRQPSGGSPEANDQVLASIVSYARTLGVPARRSEGDPLVQRGEQLFASARCGACHVPTLRTGSAPDLPELARQTFHPYTDLLLHDLGDGLSDARPTFDAEGREWRTAPLWGTGLVPLVNGHTLFLHDGRARNLTEAILWHDGEGRLAREAFVEMPREDRATLIAFLESL